MAGSPERPVNQPLTADAKKRIGSYYLSRLLEMQKESSNISPFPSHNILSFIAADAGVKIPSILINQLELPLLGWVMHGEGTAISLPILYTGHLLFGRSSPSIDSATATIEIARRVSLNSRLNEFVPFYLRIAGVAEDSTENSRIIAATYDLEDQNRLTEVNVSMSGEECPMYLNDEWDNSLHLRPNFLVSLPTYAHNPYETAALITLEMCKAAKLTDLKKSPHTKALVVQINQEGVYFARKDLNLKYINPLTSFVANLGYYAKSENGMVTIGLKNEGLQNKRGVSPWEMSVPASLQPPKI